MMDTDSIVDNKQFHSNELTHRERDPNVKLCIFLS